MMLLNATYQLNKLEWCIVFNGMLERIFHINISMKIFKQQNINHMPSMIKRTPFKTNMQIFNQNKLSNVIYAQKRYVQQEKRKQKFFTCSIENKAI